MWSDNETELDAINVQHVVATVVEILTTPHLTPITIGVFGPWGVGKSSVAKMVQRALTPPNEKVQASGTLVVYFNGWRFEGYEDAKAALMSTIIEEITKRRTLSAKAKRLVKRLWRSISVMQLVKGGAQAAAHVKLATITGGLSAPVSLLMGLRDWGTRTAAEASVGDVSDLLAGDEEKTAKGKGADASGKRRRVDEDIVRLAHRSVRDFERQFAKLLEETSLTRLVVIIDDLDRCLPSHVIDTLEAIRLFLAAKGTAFVITADETLVQHAVKDRFPGMEALKAQVGQDYLEKMIQIPVRLPLLGRADLENYLNLLFAQRHLGPARFSALCQQLLQAPGGTGTPTGDESATHAPGRTVPFGLDTAEALLGSDYTGALRADLALAKQIVHVVALSVDGNPRQVKRYLNALLLRLTMATKRGVKIEPSLAAKLMLLEYFRTEPFLQLARWQATQAGRPREIARLERVRAVTVTPAAPVGVTAEMAGAPAAPRLRRPDHDGDERASPVSRSAANRGLRDAVTPTPSVGSSAGGSTPDAREGRATEVVGLNGDVSAEDVVPLGPEGAAWLADEWLRAWLDTEPRLADQDLGTYFYFARDRFVSRAVSTQDLGPLGQAVLMGLQAPSDAVRRAVRERALGLTQPVAFAVLTALTERARMIGTPDAGDDSPYAGIYELTGWRPELGHEVVRFFRAQPLGVLRPQTPSLLLAAAAGSSAAHEARALVEGWAVQAENKGLAAGAAAALKTPTAPAAVAARP